MGRKVGREVGGKERGKRRRRKTKRRKRIERGRKGKREGERVCLSQTICSQEYKASILILGAESAAHFVPTQVSFVQCRTQQCHWREVDQLSVLPSSERNPPVHGQRGERQWFCRERGRGEGRGERGEGGGSNIASSPGSLVADKQ